MKFVTQWYYKLVVESLMVIEYYELSVEFRLNSKYYILWFNDLRADQRKELYIKFT